MNRVHQLYPNTALRVDVRGTAVTQGSKNVALVGGRVRMWETNSKTLNAWRDAIAWRVRLALKDQAWQPTAGPVEVDLVVLLPKPPTSRREHPANRCDGDLDKYQRAVGDALTKSTAIKDDAQIVAWNARKQWAPTPDLAGVIITIRPIKPTLEGEAA